MNGNTALAFVSVLLVFVILIFGVFAIMLFVPEIDVARLGLLLGFLTTISNILSGAMGFMLGKSNSNNQE